MATRITQGNLDVVLDDEDFAAPNAPPSTIVIFVLNAQIHTSYIIINYAIK